MYRNAYQRGILSVFYSGGANPLNIWDTRTQDGYISRFLDQDIKSMVLEIGGTNVSTSYMTCPKGNGVLGITMPFLIMVVKNLKKYFTFEVTILDETGTRRRFRVSNFQSTTQILPLCTVMPIGLSEGWNQIQFNLAEFTRRAYKKQFVEVQKLKVNANIRLRRIYFTERLIPEDELPSEYKLYFPLPSKGARGKRTSIAEAKDKVVAPVQGAPPEDKKEEAPKPEEPKGSKTEILKASSKASVQSVKKASTVPSSKAKLEGVPEGEAPAEGTAPAVEGKASVQDAVAAEGVAEGEAVDGEAPAAEGEATVSEEPAADAAAEKGEAQAAEGDAPPESAPEPEAAEAPPAEEAAE